MSWVICFSTLASVIVHNSPGVVLTIHSSLEGVRDVVCHGICSHVEEALGGFPKMVIVMEA